MGFLDSLFNSQSNSNQDSSSGARDALMNNFIDYGQNKADGSHDHRTNVGNDRTPAQKAGDAKRRK